MSIFSHQLTLGVALKEEATFSNYYAGPNSTFVDVLKKSIKGYGEKFIYFYGIEGRTHLLQACCHEANKSNLCSVYLSMGNEDLSPLVLENIESMDLICVDDVQYLAGKVAWEEAFFHAYNRISEAKKILIMSANVPPKLLNISLPDLVSRLTANTVYPLKNLTDEDKLTILLSRADQKGIPLTEEVARFILTHCPRNMTILYSVLNQLADASLSAQRKLTIPFIKAILQL